jgi:hypothetical protein
LPYGMKHRDPPTKLLDSHATRCARARIRHYALSLVSMQQSSVVIREGQPTLIDSRCAISVDLASSGLHLCVTHLAFLSHLGTRHPIIELARVSAALRRERRRVAARCDLREIVDGEPPDRVVRQV